MKTLKWCIDKIEMIIKAVLSMLFVIMVGSIFYQIVLRYIFHSANAWSEELARYTFVWQMLLGASLAVRKTRHMQIDFFVNKLPPLIKIAVDLAMKAVMLFFFVVIAKKGVELFYLTRRQLSTGLEMPMSWVYLSIPIGAVLMIIFTLEELAQKHLKKSTRNKGRVENA